MAKQQNLIGIKVDDKELRKLARRLGVAKKQLPKVITRALRATATKTRTIIKNEIRKVVPELPAGRVHKRTNIHPKATFSRLSTRINISWALIPLKRIKGVRGKGRYRGKKGGASYITWKGKSFPHAFRATMPSGHQGIFMRKFASGGKPILSYTGSLLTTGEPNQGLPISELGINVKEIYNKAPGVRQSIDKQATEKLRVAVVQQLNRLIK